MVPTGELRFSFVVDDHEAAVRLYRDVFGLELLQEFDEPAGRGVVLRVPNATLELLDPEHAGIVDEIEVGRRLGVRCRIALEVEDLEGAAHAVEQAGGEAMAPPVDTPWGDRNRRFRTADGIQLTLFQPSRFRPGQPGR